MPSSASSVSSELVKSTEVINFSNSETKLRYSFSKSSIKSAK
jgi:hypothetical protein